MTDAPTCNAKQLAGLALLKENKIDFEDVHTTLGKIVGNVVNAPEEPKYKQLKTTNAKMLQPRCRSLCSSRAREAMHWLLCSVLCAVAVPLVLHWGSDGDGNGEGGLGSASGSSL